MALYIVGYDLKSGESYSSLIKALQNYTNWWHCLDSTWIIESTKSAKEIKEELLQHIFEDDKLLVAFYLHSSKGGAASWFGFKDLCQTWLSNHM